MIPITGNNIDPTINKTNSPIDNNEYNKLFSHLYARYAIHASMIRVYKPSNSLFPTRNKAKNKINAPITLMSSFCINKRGFY